MPDTSNLIQYMKKTAIFFGFLFITYSCANNTEDIKSIRFGQRISEFDIAATSSPALSNFALYKTSAKETI